MSWFTKMCRNTGLMIHQIIKPVDRDQPDKQVINKKVEEEKLDSQVTLRRTTIEEVEIKQAGKDSAGS